MIEREAQERVARYAAEAAADAAARRARPRRSRATAGSRRPRSPPSCPPTRRCSHEEIFGAAARRRARPRRRGRLRPRRRLPFALTGGLFARNPETVDRVIERSPVGNLYVNRAITGAMVARQPFGGNRLSGTGTKAGGPGYLLQFVEPRVVTENTMRHGLVV